MKREIKFRAWDIPAKKYRGVDGLKDLFSIRSDGFFNEDYVLEQFTGLKDKNGVDIYEGDIILFQTFSNWDDDSMRRHIATVIFKEGCFMWKILEYGKKSNFYHANETEPIRNTNCTWGLEIIGNIFENADLVKL